MRYGFQEALTLIVGAADSLVEFEQFVAEVDTTVHSAESLGIVSAEQADFMAMMTEERFEGFKRAPVIVQFASVPESEAFVQRFDITVSKRNSVVNRAGDMMAELEVDPYSSEAADARPIEEIHDLIDNDQWDKRSDEQKAQDEEDKKKFNEARKKGDISGDSFGPNPNRKKRKVAGVDDEGNPLATVTDIKASRDDDGNLEIDDVLAVKGLYGADEEAEKARVEPHDPNREAATLAGSIAKQAALDAAKLLEVAGADPEVDDENLEIDVQGVIAIYHKVEVQAAKLRDIRIPLEAADYDLNMTIVQRNNAQGCWYACIRQLQAEESAKVLTDAGFIVEVYAVNDAGERLVPKGIQVVDQAAEEEVHPRPWNARAREIRKMKAAEKKANIKTIKPKEFIFVGNYEGAVQGTVIYITPHSYFKEHGTMWEKPLDINHLLPMDFSEVMPGVYRTKSRDWNQVSFDLASRGFRENLALQIALNNM